MLQVYDLTFMTGGRGDDDGVTDEKASEPLITVQDCFLTLLSAKPLGANSSYVCSNKKIIKKKNFGKRRDILIFDCGDQHVLFLNPQVFFCTETYPDHNHSVVT